MNVRRRLLRSNFIIRLFHWEYWPFNLVYIPVYFYWAWLCLRSGSFFFFSASNPGIENGGMLGESKIRILKKIDDRWKPRSRLYRSGNTDQTAMAIQREFSFPLITKPDIGERGWKVEKINDESALRHYISDINVPFIVQEYIDLPLELGIFYYRYPSQDRGHVSSVTIKKNLSVTGDGSRTIKQLILDSPRAKLQYKRLSSKLANRLQKIPRSGEEIELEPIGNHSRGTTFLNGAAHIDEDLRRAVDLVARQIDGFYFGRFDIRCRDFDHLRQGNFKILELNGAGSEPVHIYHPGRSIFKGYRDILAHLKILYQISRENHQKGIPYMTMKQGWREILKLRNYRNRADVKS